MRLRRSSGAVSGAWGRGRGGGRVSSLPPLSRCRLALGLLTIPSVHDALLHPDDFHLAQECFWHNPAKMPVPAEWVTVRRVRIKDSVEYVWWFSKTPFPKADNRKVLKPYSDSMKNLLKNGIVSASTGEILSCPSKERRTTEGVHCSDRNRRA